MNISLTSQSSTGPEKSWPPPDPDRSVRFTKPVDPSSAFTQSMDPVDFRKRQEADLLRQSLNAFASDVSVKRRQPFHLRYGEHGMQGRYSDGYESVRPDNPDDLDEDDDSVASEGEEGWRNSEGERLADFGVEEDLEFYDEDDVPLAELVKAKRDQRASHDEDML